MSCVLLIHQSAELYGSDKTFYSLVKSIKEKNFDSVVVLPYEGPLKRELEEIDVEVVVHPILKAHRGMLSVGFLFSLIPNVFSLFLFYRRLIKKRGVSTVYANTIAVLDGAFIKIIFRNDILHVWHIHEILEDLGAFNRMYGFLLRKFSDKVVCNSNATKRYVDEISNDSASKVVYNGVNYSNFTSIRNSREDHRGKPLTLALVGRLNDWKGHCLFLEALENSSFEIGDINVVFKGSPNPNNVGYSEILDCVTKSRFSCSVTIADFQVQVEDVWKDIDICVVPSTKPEPFGMVVIEAMASGIPVIASDHGGPSEIIKHRSSGMLFEPGSARGLASCLEELVGSSELRESLSFSGGIAVRENFREDIYVNKLHRVLGL
ncbi:glycosyltransferase family 4 protein [Spongiibacter nanhainus]|uniref:Glycosyltransferase family 4 protein n=1 Tax=Spongiibacter nanhainus TaxID=2794344 RepID=A0A7T4R2T5_9GAMM|nr:glycosyltransferase family 4 protein [Spongiibacter nanhainus]QQD19436.1 glycosyltransferase family 4 protein [Spongiibacter nanhainus]